MQCYASADLGLIAYESVGGEGLIVDEAVIVEIVRPGTGDPVPDGEVGEVLVTVFNPDYPLIRFATGDLSAVLPGPEPVRPHQHADQGLARPGRPGDQGARHVRPAAAGRRRPAPPRAGRQGAAGGDRRRAARTRCACCARSPGQPAGLEGRLAETVRSLTGLRATIELVAPGTLPNDGQVIDDQR